MPNVLFITYYFPPQGGAGVQRALKFVKYLPQFGWQPVVLTVQPKSGRLNDASLSADLAPNITVERTPALLLPEWLPWRVRNWLSRWLLGVDEQLGWLPFGVRGGRQLMHAKDIQAIYTTSAPYTVHLIGLALKRRTGRPWIADFRDPWLGNPTSPPASPLHARLIRRLERQVITTADRVLVVSEPMRQALLKRYAHLNPDHVVTLTNGFDPADFEHAQPVQPENGRFLMVYTGSFYGRQRTAGPFLQALKTGLDEGSLPPEGVRVRLVGNLGIQTAQLVEALNLKDVVQLIDYLPHQESIGHILAADALLLVVGAGPGAEAVLTGKIFEYLAAHKPILALAPPGAAADLLHETGSGIVVDPEDVPAIASQIVSLYQAWKQGDKAPTGNPEVIQRYDRRRLAGRLAGLLQAISDPKATPPTAEMEDAPSPEIARIQRVYTTQYQSEPQDRTYAWHPRNAVSIYYRQAQERAWVDVFNSHNLELAGLRILDIGCGTGNFLRFLASLGAPPENLHGIDLMTERIAAAQRLSPGTFDLRAGNAEALPYPDHSFDALSQLTVFSSILEPATRARVAAEMRRVLKPGGHLLWYDMRTPASATTRGLQMAEVQDLFPGFTVVSVRALHPHYASRLVRRSWLLAHLWERVPGRPKTHLLALLQKPAGAGPA